MMSRLDLWAMVRGAALGFALCAASCASTSPEKWQTFEITAPSENVLWAVAGQELKRLDFPVGTEADHANDSMRSGWRTSLGSFRGQGHRERAEIRFESLDNGRFQLEVRVEREHNMDWQRPTDPSYAKWESAEDDEESAQILVQRIRARLPDQLEVGEPRKPRT